MTVASLNTSAFLPGAIKALRETRKVERKEKSGKNNNQDNYSPPLTVVLVNAADTAAKMKATAKRHSILLFQWDNFQVREAVIEVLTDGEMNEFLSVCRTL